MLRWLYSVAGIQMVPHNNTTPAHQNVDLVGEPQLVKSFGTLKPNVLEAERINRLPLFALPTSRVAYPFAQKNDKDVTLMVKTAATWSPLGVCNCFRRSERDALWPINPDSGRHETCNLLSTPSKKCARIYSAMPGLGLLY